MPGGRRPRRRCGSGRPSGCSCGRWTTRSTSPSSRSSPEGKTAVRALLVLRGDLRGPRRGVGHLPGARAADLLPGRGRRRAGARERRTARRGLVSVARAAGSVPAACAIATRARCRPREPRRPASPRPSLRRMPLTWRSTVFSLTCSRSAISRLRRRSATSSATSRSRSGERGQQVAARGGALLRPRGRRPSARSARSASLRSPSAPQARASRWAAVEQVGGPLGVAPARSQALARRRCPRGSTCGSAPQPLRCVG